MPGRVITETERLILRELVDEDAEAYFLLATHPDVVRHIPVPMPANVAEALDLMRRRRASDYEALGYGRWACVLKETGEVAGWSGPRLLPEVGEVELGYRFLPQHWGKGLATEAGATALRHWFGPLGGKEIIALVDPANVGSVRVVQKLGFRNTGGIVITGNTVDRWHLEAPCPR